MSCPIDCVNPASTDYLGNCHLGIRVFVLSLCFRELHSGLLPSMDLWIPQTSFVAGKLLLRPKKSPCFIECVASPPGWSLGVVVSFSREAQIFNYDHIQCSWEITYVPLIRFGTIHGSLIRSWVCLRRLLRLITSCTLYWLFTRVHIPSEDPLWQMVAGRKVWVHSSVFITAASPCRVACCP